MARPGPVALRLSSEDREVLEAAARRSAVTLAGYIRGAALERAVMGGIVIPPEVAVLIRQQARERGIDEVLLATLIAQYAVSWPPR